jgi:hypothetical protein
MGALQLHRPAHRNMLWRMPYLLLYLVFSALALWLASRAKPLGTMPYRWGTWVGLQTAWMAVTLIISCLTVRAGASLVSTAALSVLALTAAAASFGILRHRRFGVVAFVCTYLLLIPIGPFLDTAPGQPYVITIRENPLTGFHSSMSLPTIIAILSTAGYFICTVIYFKRRWPLMINPGT